MSSEATIGGAPGTALSDATGPAALVERRWARPDGRRILQLVLATIWLFDGLLQLQAYFFTRSFGNQMIRSMAPGNPSVIAGPINWAGATIGNHIAVNSTFALMQAAIGFGIAWRPTVKVGLAASIVWSIGVWWVGEGLGGVFSGVADPVTGAPGAVILYALLAGLLWPAERTRHPSRFIADRAVGAPVAKGLWLILWGSLSYFAVVGPNRAPQGLHLLFHSLAPGEPGWLASLDLHLAVLVAHRGLGISVALAASLALVAVAIYLPRIVANGAVCVASALSAAFWVLGENFGTLFTNGATDLNSGPLLVLVAISYWQSAKVVAPAARSGAAHGKSQRWA